MDAVLSNNDSNNTLTPKIPESAGKITVSITYVKYVTSIGR